MNPKSPRPAIVPVACALAALVCFNPAHSTAEPRVLDDQTAEDRWQLSNGLRVVTRQVPQAAGVSITLCYDVGSDDDPAGQEGLSWLAAETIFTSAVGDVPARTREEMDGLRPQGWNLKIAPRHTILCEIAGKPQFPGVLHEVAARLRGVTLTEANLKATATRVRTELARAYDKNLDVKVYHSLHLLAIGRGPDAAGRYASGKGIQRTGVKELRQRIETLYVPRNAVLSLAGDLGGVDVRRLVENEFGSIASGPAAPDRQAARPTGGTWDVPGIGLSQPLGAVGVIAPALSDTSHPSFFLYTVLLGAACKQSWPEPTPPLSGRFEYSILDDPDLVRFYPPPMPVDSVEVAMPLWMVVSGLQSTPPGDRLDNLERGVSWLLGGELPPPVLQKMKTEPDLLYVLGSGMAVRELRGGVKFWDEYRRRFRESRGEEMKRWSDHYLTLENIVQLRYEPPR